MPDTPTFPLTPVDRRYLERLDRYRAKESRPVVPQPDDPIPRLSPVPAAARRTLRRYCVRDWAPEYEAAERLDRVARPAASLFDRWPRWLVSGLTLLGASGLVPFLVFAFIRYRPDVHPRLVRHRLVSPVDLRKVLAVTRSVVGFYSLVRKQLVRRLNAE